MFQIVAVDNFDTLGEVCWLRDLTFDSDYGIC